MENAAYHLEIKYSVEFLRQLLSQVDEAAGLVLIGDLSRFRVGALLGVTREEIAVADEVYRASYGRVHIPLLGLNKYHLKKEGLAHVGLRTLVREVQVERYGRLLCHAPNFFQDGAWLTDWFQLEFLQSLEEDGVIKVAMARPSACIPFSARQPTIIIGRG
ncbi:MAG: hypothetical protein HND44_21870 [Chloroflexi bacterium]|nr:hypothetical protein [Ardenticatenaceae bacterium]MBL1131092.1 hypothetical protein [Chloroflexota bacterium]NOG37190.1 hypothetical protein [Chloroflexota bacterium]GIK55274.1 MAG: hypothetical protein BroJett015_09370 [Chloroflexota bacterium]